MNVSRGRGLAGLRAIALFCAIVAALDAAFAALTITESTSPTLGTLVGGPGGRNFILNTDDTVSGSDSADYLFGAVSGDLTVKKTGGPQSANIVADNITTSGGVSVNAVPCSYDGGSQANCTGSGINVTVLGNKSLLVGVDLDTTASHDSSDSPTVTYDINITLL